MSIRHAHTHGAVGGGRRQRGASLVEYALLVALIAVVCIGAVAFLGSSGSAKLDTAGQGIAGASTTTAPDCSVRPGGYATGAGYAYPCFDPVANRGFFP